MRSLRAILTCMAGAFAACTTALDPPAPRPAGRTFGDFLIPVDSILVTPNPAYQGETLLVRIFAEAVQVDCVPWTIITMNSGYRVDYSTWGRRTRVPEGSCMRVSDQPLRVVVNLPGGHDFLTLAARQPSGEPLERRVPVLPGTRPPPAAR
jgi:hypothetical protein